MSTAVPRDGLLNAVRLVDVLACVGLFAIALLCRWPLVPHFEISSDTMDPLVHAWRMLEGTTGWFSAHNPLYGYGRAWSHLPLLLAADGLLGVARGVAILGSTVPVFVYIAGRILAGGVEPGPAGAPARRAGALVGPLLGAALLARFPGLLDEQLGTNVYRTVELAAVLTVPFAVLLRAAVRGEIAHRYAVLIAAAAAGVLLPMMALNHPYGAAAGGALAPMLAFFLLRLRRDALTPVVVFLGAGALVSLPHVIYLVLESQQMGEGLVGYARSDTEFGAMDWPMTFDRLLNERGGSRLGGLLTRASFLALFVGFAVGWRRPRLGRATLMAGVSGLGALGTAALMSKLSQHIQPYHWRPLLPFFALAAGLTITSLLDVSLRRTREERGRDVEERRPRSRVLAPRIPVALLALGIGVLCVNGVRHGFDADEGFYQGLWEDGIVRQATHHDRIGRRLRAIRARTGQLPLFAGIEFPPYELQIDQLAVTLDLRLAGVSSEELLALWQGESERSVLLHLGSMGAVPEALTEALDEQLGTSLRVIDGGSGFTVVTGTPADFRLWTRSLCHPDGGPGWLLRPEEGEPYRLHGDLEVRHMVQHGELHREAYVWAHPCLEPFGWPGLDGAEFPFGLDPADPLAPVATDQFRWVELPPTRISRTEIARRSWEACVDAGACAAQEWPEPADPWLPVTGVTAAEAEGFCRWLVDGRERDGRIWTGALPSELQWESAMTWANGVSEGRTRWPWGDDPELDRANVGARDTGPRPVGSGAAGVGPNELEDQIGNVAEWVVGAVRPGEDGSPGERRPDELLLAGGSWRTPDDVILTSVFQPLQPEQPLDDVGFRCVIQGEDPP